jgi:hypothetical protein
MSFVEQLCNSGMVLQKRLCGDSPASLTAGIWFGNGIKAGALTIAWITSIVHLRLGRVRESGVTAVETSRGGRGPADARSNEWLASVTQRPSPGAAVREGANHPEKNGQNSM